MASPRARPAPLLLLLLALAACLLLTQPAYGQATCAPGQFRSSTGVCTNCAAGRVSRLELADGLGACLLTHQPPCPACLQSSPDGVACYLCHDNSGRCGRQEGFARVVSGRVVLTRPSLPTQHKHRRLAAWPGRQGLRAQPDGRKLHAGRARVLPGAVCQRYRRLHQLRHGRPELAGLGDVCVLQVSVGWPACNANVLAPA